MIYFVSGIDTDAGKTVVTGCLAAGLQQKGIKVITQKLVQTGCPDGVSSDVLVHRKLMGGVHFPEDDAQMTMPCVMSYPASPHLVAEKENRTIDLTAIAAATTELDRRYDIVLVEGAGGLMVPLNRERLTIDYAAEKGYPLILVTSGKLGSINHTLLSLEAAERRGMKIAAVVYNRYPVIDEIIEAETRAYLKTFLARHYPQTAYGEIPEMKSVAKFEITDFDEVLNSLISGK